MSEEEDLEQPDPGLREGDVQIADVVQISVGGRKKHWYPCVSHIDGHRFVKLEKWDRTFVHMCTGASLQLHKTLGYKEVDLQELFM